MKHESTKTYGHEQGLSCAFRQWRAESHCRLVHGYALAFRFVFGAEELDSKGWVVDFGGLKVLKAALVGLFDHTVAVDGEDPALDTFLHMHKTGLMDVRMFPGGVGCEKFAKAAFHKAVEVINADPGMLGRVKVLSCECMEHAGNSAIYKGEHA